MKSGLVKFNLLVHSKNNISLIMMEIPPQVKQYIYSKTYDICLAIATLYYIAV